MIAKTEAVVIKTFDFRETSLIATFFTKDYGKVKGILKGIRKDPKKFGSHLDRFSVNDIVFYHSPHRDLHLVSQCDLKQYFFPVRQDYKRNMAAHYALELVDVIMPSEEHNPEIYKLLMNYFTSLETARDIDKLVYVFQIKILLLSGFRPHIDSCVRCQKRIQGRVRFSMQAGGLICAHCPTKETAFTVISKGTIATMLHIEREPWAQSLNLGLTKIVRAELKYILNNFLVYHLERKIKTAKFLNT